MTLDDMRGQVIAWLGLQDLGGGSSTTMLDEVPLVEQQLYQGTLDLLARTRCVVRCVELLVTADVSEYLVGSLILALVDIEDGLPKVTRDSTYNPSFTLIRSDVLRLQPPPSEDGEVQVWAVKKPARMVNDADSLGDEQFGAIPEEFQDAIVTYALWKMSDYSDDQSGGNGERYRMLYEGQDGRGGRLAQIRSAVNKRGTARAPRRRVVLPGVRDADHWAG
jgi:hypothetical protein